MSVHEVYAGIEWMYATLTADATLMSLAPGGVNRGVAEPNTPTPYIVMNYQSGNDTNTANGIRLLAKPLFLVKAVGPASMSDVVAQVAARIDDLLKPPASGTVTGALVTMSGRQSPLLMDEDVNGAEWVNIGGLYGSEIQQISS